MSTPRILLSPPEQPEPHGTRIPYGHAARWRTPFERDDQEIQVSVFMSPRAYVRVCAHAGSDLDNEVGGWLIGKWRVDKRTGQEFTVIDAILPADHIRHGSAFLTFTQDSQVALYDQLTERFPEKELVGWYHTHPRMGIFLSDYDLWLHSNFFPDPHQVALVIEPHSATGGFFIRQKDGWLDPRRYFGFYELTNNQKRSVVHWRNMLPDAEHIVYQGGKML
jgi:proteasome lid subunit RPN8/RPN11